MKITYNNWWEAKNHNVDLDYNMVCDICSHVSEAHENLNGEDIYCIHCDCKKFKVKIRNNLIVYDKGK